MPAGRREPQPAKNTYSTNAAIATASTTPTTIATRPVLHGTDVGDSEGLWIAPGSHGFVERDAGVLHAAEPSDLEPRRPVETLQDGDAPTFHETPFAGIR